MVKFSQLGLKKEIVEVLSRFKYDEAFGVQEKVIPLTLQKKNVVFTSRTGSGKTIAYSLGFLSRINKKLGIQMVVMVPTRELAIQVGKEITRIAEPLNLNVGVLFGGREITQDKHILKKKNHIMIATPGRLITHVNNKALKLGDVGYLVFDESDQMFDQGFDEDCAYIKSRVGKLCQVILSSATINEKVKFFMEQVIVDYELVKIGHDIPENIVQEKIYVEIIDKDELLIKVLKKYDYKKVLLFTNRKNRTYHLSEFLKENKINAQELNSDLEQNERIENLNKFKQGKINVLVATDIAARGLHIEQVDLVINYDVPNKSEFYVHRIGRTGRIDKIGHTITFICEEDKDRFGDIMFDYQPDVKEIKI